MSQRDTLHRFLIDKTHVRGEFVRLEASWQEVLGRAEYPENVRDILGEAMAAAALLTATIKFDGRLTLQARGNGPLHLLVVQATADGGLRAVARWQGEVPKGPLSAVFGQAQMVVTVETGKADEQYQGVVEVSGENLSEAIGNYFAESEQLPTGLWLSADDGAAAGLLLQRLPGSEEDEDADAWDRSRMLAETVTGEELRELPAEELLRRLFHEEQLRLFEPQELRFSCSCSRERSAGMIRQLGEAEAREVLAEQGDLSVTCEFCSARYRFDSVDVERLFADGSSSGPHDTLH